MVDSAGDKSNTSLHGEVSGITYGPHIFRARRSYPAGRPVTAEGKARAFGERAGSAVFAKTSWNDEASRCPVRCGIDHTVQNRSHRVGQSFGQTDAGGDGVAQTV